MKHASGAQNPGHRNGLLYLSGVFRITRTCSSSPVPGRWVHRPSRSPEQLTIRLVNSLQGTSSAEDTKKAVAAFLDAGIDLLLFCGGDGTARDVFEVVQQKVPILGIPAGVKMYSAVFALDPQTAAALVSGPFNLKDAEVMDVDEEAYRRGFLIRTCSGLQGFLLMPI